jgi:hypothetical protein
MTALATMRNALGPAPESTTTERDALHERLADVLEVTGEKLYREANNAGTWDAPPGGLSDIDSQLFFHYALNEPRHLVLQIVRRLFLWPLLRRQVEFNQSVRNALLQLWLERNELRRTVDETNRRLVELERTVATLTQNSPR